MIRVLIFFITFTGLASQAQTPFFQSYELPDKGENVEVNTLFQDRTGFIWIGTNRGLTRYDGFEYVTYTINDSLPDNQVTAITQDSIGRIWLGHATGKISYLEEGRIRSFTTPEGTAVKEISDIYFDKKGTLWFSTLNDGLYYFLKNRLYRLDEMDGLPDIYVYDIAESPDGKIWIGTDGGIAICELEGNKAQISLITQKDGLPDNIVKKILFDKDDNVWLGTQDKGIVKYRSSKKEFEQVKKWDFGTIQDVVLKHDQLWATTIERGLMVVSTKNLLEVENFQGTLGASKLLIDQEKNIWVSNKSKLLRTPGIEIGFIEKFNDGIKQSIVALTVDREEKIWFSNGVDLFVMKKVGSDFLVKRISSMSSPNYPIISLHTDSTGNIWAGSFGKGVWQLGGEGNLIHYYNSELRNGNILGISSKGGEVWLATLEGATQIRITNQTHTIRNFGTKEGLTSDFIYQVFVDSKGRVWFGTDGKDIDMMDERGVHHFTLGDKPKVVYGFSEDKGNNIWANVQNNGLYKLIKNEFRPFIKLKNNNVNSFTVDTEGNLIVSHEVGLERINVDENQTQLYAHEVGIVNKKGNLNSIAQDSRGKIYIGTENGIICYQPQSKIHDKIKPIPFIKTLRGGEKIFSSKKDPIFDYASNDITVSYMAFWYQNLESLNYQYMLENYDNDWIASHDRQVTYSRLPPGNYTFKLRAAIDAEFQNSKQVSIHFTIAPPFWKTIWFYALIIIATIYGVYLFIKLRERKLQQERKLLKVRVEERTRELQTRNEEIQAQSEELQAQSAEIIRINNHLEELVKLRTEELEKKNKALEEYAFINAHKLRSPVASILGLVSIMGKLPQSPETKECTEHLEQAAKALDEIVGSITDAIEKAD